MTVLRVIDALQLPKYSREQAACPAQVLRPTRCTQVLVIIQRSANVPVEVSITKHGDACLF